MKKITALLMALIMLVGTMSFSVLASGDDVDIYLNDKASSKVKAKYISGEPYICVEDAFRYCGFKTEYHDSYDGYWIYIEKQELGSDWNTTLLRLCFESDMDYETGKVEGESSTRITEEGRTIFKLKTINDEMVHKHAMIEQDSDTHYIHHADLSRILDLTVMSAPEINAIAIYLNKKAPEAVHMYNRRGIPVDICPIFKEQYAGFGYSTNLKDVLIIPKANAVSNEGIKVSLNGALLEFDVMPTTINGRTMVPLRAIFEALSATVDWKAETQTVVSVKDKTTISLTIGSNAMYVNNKKIILDSPAKEVNGRTLVPVRAISEAFGVKVDWDENNFLVILREPKYVNLKTKLMYNSSNQIIEVPEFEVNLYENDGWTTGK